MAGKWVHEWVAPKEHQLVVQKVTWARKRAEPTAERRDDQRASLAVATKGEQKDEPEADLWAY